MNAEKISDGLLKIERDGADRLAIETLIPANSFALTKLMGNRRNSGSIVEGDEVAEWRFDGFVEHEGTILAYGPYRPGKTLSEVLRLPAEEALPLLARLASAYDVLARKSMPVDRLHSHGVVLLDDGGVLFIPPDILSSIREHQGMSAQIEQFERYNFGDIKDEENRSFSMAVLAYRVLTGEHPYDGEDDEAIHNRMRAASHIPAGYRRPELKPEISRAIEAALSEPTANAVEPAEWARRFASWSEGYTRDLTDEERARIEEKATAEAKKREGAFRRKEFGRKHGRRVVVIALIAVIVGSIPGTIIYNALQPRVTAGFSAPEVIQTFYTSVAELDHMTMEDCVVDDAGRPLIREVTNLFVLTRMRMSVEMQTGFVDAQSWRDAGLPELENQMSPYGIANLQIDFIRGDEEEQIFDVEYEKWSPDYDAQVIDENAVMVGIVGNRIEERLYLRRDRGDWVIYRIERTDEERLSIRELRDEA